MLMPTTALAILPVRAFVLFITCASRVRITRKTGATCRSSTFQIANGPTDQKEWNLYKGTIWYVLLLYIIYQIYYINIPYPRGKRHLLRFLLHSGSLGREQWWPGSRVSAISTSVKFWHWPSESFLTGEDWSPCHSTGPRHTKQIHRNGIELGESKRFRKFSELFNVL